MGINLKENDILPLLVRLFVGGVFIYASIDKITHPHGFAELVNNYHILPSYLVNLMAIFLPWMEMVCGVFLIIGFYKDGAALIINLVMVMFIVAIVINVFRGVDLACGCFTVSSNAKSDALGLLYRDLGLFVLTLYLLYNRSKRYLLYKG